MKIYTRGGDRGETSLLRGGRVRKNDPWIEAYGTIDELNSAIGLARSTWPDSPIDSQLDQIQRDLLDLGALLAAGASDQLFSGPSPRRIAEMETSIDQMESQLEPLTAFILPGGSPEASQLHMARTICRRAERLTVQLPETELLLNSIAYLNRLSDYLFVAARYANRQRGVADIIWTT